MTNKDIFALLVERAKKHGFDIYNESWRESYFVFSTGEDSIVHFKVKQCKGWLFGMWLWQEKEVEGQATKRTIQIFGQPINNIDKFKPSASPWVYEFDIDLNAEQARSSLDTHLMIACCNRVLGPIRYDRTMAWCVDNSFGGWPKSHFHAKMKRFGASFNAVKNNFMGDVGLRDKKYGAIVYEYSYPYPFKFVVLFFKYLFNKEYKPEWEKL